MPAVRACDCVWTRVCMCVLEASPHLFDRWDCASLSLSPSFSGSLLCLYALFWFVFISVWHVHIWLCVCVCGFFFLSLPVHASTVRVCIEVQAHAASECLCIATRFTAAVIWAAWPPSRSGPGTTWAPFALWTLKDRSIRLNGFLHLKQHSWSLHGTLVRLFHYYAAVNVGSVRLCQVTKAENYYAKHLNCAIALNCLALLWMAAESEWSVH